MKLIIGLGNPGAKYEKTWHNLGFATLDQLQKNWQLPNFKKEKKFSAMVAIGNFNDQKIILAKPQTFMNDSGLAVKALLNYYKISPADLVVIHDDLDLPLTKIRISNDSSAGGHNGVKSIIENLKSQKFIRLKIGIKTPKLAKIDPANYVLEKINLLEKGKVKKTLIMANKAVETIIASGLAAAMNQFN